jgi:pantothenate kinase type III
LERAVELYRQYGLGAGQPWLMEDGTCFRQRAIKADGTLEVENSKQVKEITALTKGQVWGYQQESPLGFAVADIGNSRTKLAIYAQARQAAPSQILNVAHDGWQVRELKSLKSLYPFLQLGVPVFWASVNDEARRKFCQAMQEAQIAAAEVPKRTVRLDLGTYSFEQIGIDRMALSEAALELGYRSFVAVGAGTATTVEIVRDGTLQGGFILAGLETKLEALHRQTGNLPLLGAADLGDATAAQYPSQTAEAMAWGAVLETAALINRLVKDERGHGSGKEVAILVTGGLGLLLERHIPGSRYIADMVVQGARVMALGGVRGSDR